MIQAEPCWNCGNHIWYVGDGYSPCICCGFYARLWPERLRAARPPEREP
jgi:hypothetical protein